MPADLFPDPAESTFAGGTISALRPTNRDPRRFTVKVDGKAMGTLSQKLIKDLGLVIGSPWTAELDARMADAVVYDKAFRMATRRLARRAMSSGMVRDKLREVGRRKPGDTPFPPEIIDQVLDRLTQLDLLDDETYGQALIRELTRGKPAGPMLLRQKLYAKGLDRNLIDRLVADATSDPEAQADGATQFARKKIRPLAHLDTQTVKRRLYGQLARRGFAPDAIRAAMDTVLRELADPAED